MTDTFLTQRKYDRFSHFYDTFEKPAESTYGKWRRELITPLSGKVLEVGVGTGRNLQYYNAEADVTGIELSNGMLNKARERANMLGVDVNLLHMDAQKMMIPDNSFDYIVCTFVFCSIPDQIAALNEMKRVCKPNGKILMIETVLSRNMAIASVQKIISPFFKTFLGYSVSRNTIESIKAAGLEIKSETSLGLFDIFRRIEAQKVC